jgi:hypothetical protein
LQEGRNLLATPHTTLREGRNLLATPYTTLRKGRNLLATNIKIPCSCFNKKDRGMFGISINILSLQLFAKKSMGRVGKLVVLCVFTQNVEPAKYIALNLHSFSLFLSLAINMHTRFYRQKYTNN